MNKSRFFIFIIVCLVISNVVALVLFFSHKPPHMIDNRPRNLIVERLHFDQDQIRAYDDLIREHRQSIHQLDDQIRAGKEELFGSLGSTYDPTKKDSLLQRLNQIQRQIEQVHVQHFLDIKKICHPNQMDDFDSLTRDLAHIFRPKH